MDKLSKLQALTGKQDVVASQSTGANDVWGHSVRASHIYEGSDNDSDLDQKCVVQSVPKPQVSKKIAREGEESHYEFPQSMHRGGGMQGRLLCLKGWCLRLTDFHLTRLQNLGSTSWVSWRSNLKNSVPWQL